MHEREPTRVCPSLPPFPSLTSLSFPHTEPGSCTKSIGHLALPESSHRGLYVPGESEASHKGKVTGGGEGKLREGKAGWRPLSYQRMEEQNDPFSPLPTTSLFLSVSHLLWDSCARMLEEARELS